MKAPHARCTSLSNPPFQIAGQVEDTDRVTFESIEARFGAAVRRIVEGETKVSKISSKVSKQGRSGFEEVADVKADDLQQMFLAMTEEAI